MGEATIKGVGGKGEGPGGGGRGDGASPGKALQGGGSTQ